MDRGANSWPSLAADGTLAKFQATKAAQLADDGSDASIKPGKADTREVPLTEAILKRLVAADLERKELKKEAQQANARITSMEQSIRTLAEEAKESRKHAECRNEAISDQFVAMTSKVEGLSTEITPLSGMPGELAAMSNELSIVAGEIGSIAERADRLEHGSGVEFKGVLAELVEVVAVLAEGAEISKVEVAAISDELSTAASEVAELKRVAADLARDLRASVNRARFAEERLSGHVAAMTEAVAAVVSEVDAVSQDVAAASDSDREVGELVAELAKAKEAAANMASGLTGEVHQAAELARGAQVVADEIDVRLSASVTKVSGDVAAIASTVGGLTNEVHAAAQLAHQAQLTAANVENRAGDAAQLRLDFDAQASELRERLDRLEAHRERINAETDSGRVHDLRDERDAQPPEASDHADLHRSRWAEHLRVQAALRKQREANRHG